MDKKELLDGNFEEKVKLKNVKVMWGTAVMRSWKTTDLDDMEDKGDYAIINMPPNSHAIIQYLEELIKWVCVSYPWVRITLLLNNERVTETNTFGIKYAAIKFLPYTISVRPNPAWPMEIVRTKIKLRYGIEIEGDVYDWISKHLVEMNNEGMWNPQMDDEDIMVLRQK